MVNRYCELERRTGIGNYSKELVSAMLRVNQPITIESFPQGWIREIESSRARKRTRLASPPAAEVEINGHRNPNTSSLSWSETFLGVGRRISERFPPDSLSNRLLQRQYRSLSAECDLYHEPNCIPWVNDLPTVTTLPDLSVILHPEWHPAARIADYERSFERGVRQCVRILTISDFSRRQIIEDLGIPADKVSRTYCGINPSLRPLSEEEFRIGRQDITLPDDYLLYVGTLEPRKNLLMLLQTYCSLPATIRDRCPLVLVGGWGWNTEKLAAYLEDEARHKGVVHLGYVPDDNLITLYNGARALLFPSFYEGFGLPPLEMMACGGAVLTSTAEALVETTGGRAHSIDPMDADGWRSALELIVQDDDWRDHLRQGVTDWARRFTWERCAEETMEAYRLSLVSPTRLKTMRPDS